MNNDYIKKLVGKNIKTFRENRKISQEKLSELIDIGTSALSRLECGKSYPSSITIEKISNALNIKPYLLYIDNEDIDIDLAYEETVKNLELLKSNKILFKSAYDFVNELVQRR